MMPLPGDDNICGEQVNIEFERKYSQITSGLFILSGSCAGKYNLIWVSY